MRPSSMVRYLIRLSNRTVWLGAPCHLLTRKDALNLPCVPLRNRLKWGFVVKCRGADCLRLTALSMPSRSNGRYPHPTKYGFLLKGRFSCVNHPCTAPISIKLWGRSLIGISTIHKQTSTVQNNRFFAPIDDALMRGQIKAHDVNIVLLAGGSSRIPACNDQIREYFSSARILQFDNHDDCKFAVARGAAMQALAKALTGGAGLVTTVCQDDISIRSEHGLVPLIPRGTSLPYPANGNKSDMRRARCPA